MNRSQAPQLSLPETIDFIDPNLEKLRNGVPVYLLDGGSQEVSRIEFYFKAGTAYHDKPLQATFTNALINSGTSTMTADEIAAKLDYYGAYFQTEVTRDWFKVTLYSMNRFLPEIMPIVSEVLMDPIFPVDELEILRKNKYERFKVNTQKVKTLARREFAKRLFGDHPYGSLASDDDYKAITRDDCKSYYERLIHPDNCRIFISGMMRSDIIQLLNEAIGGWSRGAAEMPHDIARLDSSQHAEYTITKKDAVQSAIRMGRVTIDRKHKDHHDLKILSTVFGGYFGSRLMSNIREDKGYTYGIGSNVVSEQHASYMLIVTEVGAQYTEPTIAEIHKEMERLRVEEISKEELTLVKNYIIGALLKSSDGPFAMGDRFKSLHLHDMDYAYYDTFLKRVRSITAAELQECAKTYLDPADFLTVVARPELQA